MQDCMCYTEHGDCLSLFHYSDVSTDLLFSCCCMIKLGGSNLSLCFLPAAFELLGAITLCWSCTILDILCVFGWFRQDMAFCKPWCCMHFCCGELGGSSSKLNGLGIGLDGVKQYLSFGCAPEDRTGLFTGPVVLWLMEEHGCHREGTGSYSNAI